MLGLVVGKAISVLLARDRARNPDTEPPDGLIFASGCAILHYTDRSMYAIVAQLDRAFGSDPEGQRFESSRSHQKTSLQCVFCNEVFCFC